MTTLNLGDTVSGIYFGAPFVGVLISHGPSGIGVRTDITVHGRRRDGVHMSHNSEIRTLKLVKRGVALDSDIVTASQELGGDTYLRGGYKLQL